MPPEQLTDGLGTISTPPVHRVAVPEDTLRQIARCSHSTDAMAGSAFASAAVSVGVSWCIAMCTATFNNDLMLWLLPAIAIILMGVAVYMFIRSHREAAEHRNTLRKLLREEGLQPDAVLADAGRKLAIAIAGALFLILVAYAAGLVAGLIIHGGN